MKVIYRVGREIYATPSERKSLGKDLRSEDERKSLHQPDKGYLTRCTATTQQHHQQNHQIKHFK